jgi:hypothetical protein
MPECSSLMVSLALVKPCWRPSQDTAHLLRADAVETIRIGRRRRESNRAEPDFLRQMLINPPYVRDTGTQRHACADRVGTVALKEHLYFRDNDVVASSPVMEHTHLVIEFAVAINADCDADPVFGEKINHLLVEQCRIGG